MKMYSGFFMVIKKCVTVVKTNENFGRLTILFFVLTLEILVLYHKHKPINANTLLLS